MRRHHARTARRAVLFAALRAVALAWLLIAGPGPTHAASPSAPVLAPAWPRSIGFRTRTLLVEHYRKHGREFGSPSPSDYLARAQALRDRPVGGGVLEIVREDGVTTRFDRRSGAFIAFGRDGVIHTFFKPRDGERYFRRQALRHAGGE